jgi:hypothetical protein
LPLRESELQKGPVWAGFWTQVGPKFLSQKYSRFQQNAFAGDLQRDFVNNEKVQQAAEIVYACPRARQRSWRDEVTRMAFWESQNFKEN